MAGSVPVRLCLKEKVRARRTVWVQKSYQEVGVRQSWREKLTGQVHSFFGDLSGLDAGHPCCSVRDTHKNFC